jgi:hypothetical protein
MADESKAQENETVDNLHSHLLWVCACKIAQAKKRLVLSDGTYPTTFKSEFDVTDRFILCGDILKSLRHIKMLMYPDVIAFLDEDDEPVVIADESKPDEK